MTKPPVGYPCAECAKVYDWRPASAAEIAAMRLELEGCCPQCFTQRNPSRHYREPHALSRARGRGRRGPNQPAAPLDSTPAREATPSETSSDGARKEAS